MINLNKMNGPEFGADPEAFFEKEGQIIGSEKVITPYNWHEIVKDGVQLEFKPRPGWNEYSAVSNMKAIMNRAQNQLKSMPNVKICFKPVVEVGEKELESLSDDSKMLGCLPSENIYGFKSPDVDGKIFRVRSAGGHIHLGLYNNSLIFDDSQVPHLDNRVRLMPILDVLVGNTCCLLDLDPAQRTRRKLYGRPGEYRLPWYGLEYRTLSNFWLRSPALAEFVWGMSKLAVGVLNETLSGREDLERELLYALDWRKVVKAIYLNDRIVALLNWFKVREFLMKHSPAGSVLWSGNMEKFDRVIEIVGKAGSLDVFFPIEGDDVLNKWGTPESWDSFLKSIQ